MSIENDLEKLREAGKAMLVKAKQEGRSFTANEESLYAQIIDKIMDLELELPQKPLTVENSRILSTPGKVFNTLGEQFMAVKHAGIPGGKIDPRLYNASTGLNETVPSEGGFLVQQSFSSEILQDAFDEGLLAKRCRKQLIPANANGIKINGVDETSRATGSRYGGIQSYWLDEASEKQYSKPKFRQISLELKKNVVLIAATDELLQDAASLESFIRETAPKEIGFQVDDGIVNGTGAGTLLGIMNSGALVTVSKEAGQAANTIVAENIFKMYSRTLGRSSNYIWLYNKSCLPQIYALSLAVGTGGGPLFIAGGTISGQPENRLLGLPMIEVEQCQVLGTTGDLILADLKNGYIVADKGRIQTDVSIHVRFVYDESLFRLVYRVDGQPVRASALTPYKGGAANSQSHFIALETRS